MRFQVLAAGMVALATVGHGQQAALRISGVVMARQIATKVNPRYPAEAKAKGISGMVVMRATISKDGTVENVAVVSGPEELRASSTDAVQQWTYKPYVLNGAPTRVETTIMLNYTTTKPAEPAGEDLGLFDGPPLPEAEDAGPPVPGAVRVSDSAMTLLKKVAPRYPADARAQGIEGSVVIRAIIGKDGAVSQMWVVSGPEELRGSALGAVKQWRYKPYMLSGVPTEVDMRITVMYNMRGG